MSNQYFHKQNNFYIKIPNGLENAALGYNANPLILDISIVVSFS